MSNVLATGTWITPSTCPRRLSGATNREGRWIRHSWEDIINYDELDVWLLAFPVQYLIDVVIPTTNPHLSLGVTTLNEFITYMGLRKYMSCYVGIEDYRDWWSREAPSMWKGAPWRFNEFMSLNRFNDITAGLRYANPATMSIHPDP